LNFVLVLVVELELHSVPRSSWTTSSSTTANVGRQLVPARLTGTGLLLLLALGVAAAEPALPHLVPAASGAQAAVSDWYRRRVTADVPG